MWIFRRTAAEKVKFCQNSKSVAMADNQIARLHDADIARLGGSFRRSLFWFAVLSGLISALVPLLPPVWEYYKHNTSLNQDNVHHREKLELEQRALRISWLSNLQAVISSANKGSGEGGAALQQASLYSLRSEIVNRFQQGTDINLELGAECAAFLLWADIGKKDSCESLACKAWDIAKEMMCFPDGETPALRKICEPMFVKTHKDVLNTLCK